MTRGTGISREHLERRTENWLAVDLVTGQGLNFAISGAGSDATAALFDESGSPLSHTTESTTDAVTLIARAEEDGTVYIDVRVPSAPVDAGYAVDLSTDAYFPESSYAYSFYSQLVMDSTTGQNRTVVLDGTITSIVSTSGTIESIAGSITRHGETAEVAYASLVDNGDGTFELNLDLSEIDLTETHPFSHDVHLRIVIDGNAFEAVYAWTIAAYPERTAFMYVDGVLYGKTMPEVVFRPSDSLYVIDYTTTYSPDVYVTTDVVRFTYTGSDPEPAPFPIDPVLLYYSVGDRYVTSLNEVLWSSFDRVYDGADYATFEIDNNFGTGYVFFLQPADYDGDSEITYEDLDAVNLDTLDTGE